MSLLFLVLAMLAAAGVLLIFIALSGDRVALEATPTDLDALVSRAWLPPADGDHRGLRDRLDRPFELMAERVSDREVRKGRPSLAEKLARADLRLRASEFVMIQVGVVLGMILLSFVRFGVGWQMIPAAIGGYFLPLRYLKYRQRRRLKAFNRQLVDTLTLLSNAMKTGYSLPQAMDSVARNGH